MESATSADKNSGLVPMATTVNAQNGGYIQSREGKYIRLHGKISISDSLKISS